MNTAARCSATCPSAEPRTASQGSSHRHAARAATFRTSVYAPRPIDPRTGTAPRRANIVILEPAQHDSSAGTAEVVIGPHRPHMHTNGVPVGTPSGISARRAVNRTGTKRPECCSIHTCAVRGFGPLGAPGMSAAQTRGPVPIHPRAPAAALRARVCGPVRGIKPARSNSPHDRPLHTCRTCCDISDIGRRPSPNRFPEPTQRREARTSSYSNRRRTTQPQAQSPS